VTAKVLLIVLGIGACGLWTLSLRQGQLRAGHDLAQARLDLVRIDERIRDVRARIAVRTSPEEISVLAGELRAMVPAIRVPDVPETDTPTAGGST